jgi:hypothetical protein
LKIEGNIQEKGTSMDIRPIPDPTILTTQQLIREIGSVREVFDTRLDGMDKAISLLQANVDKSPTVGEIYVKHEQMFKNIEIRFDERDIRTDQTARDSKVAVDAALQAAKEAVGEQNKSSATAIAKSDAATTKQLDAILAIIQTTTKSFDDKINDVKERLTLREGHSKGLGDGWGYIVGVIGLLSAIVTNVFYIIRH